MPRLSEIELRPTDILLADVPDDVIASLQTQAAARNVPFSDYLLEVIADHFGTPREALSTATVIVLDPE
jgi:hypothetical protein